MNIKPLVLILFTVLGIAFFDRRQVMGIEIKVPRAVQIRRLEANGLDARDIAKVTGWAPAVVREALAVQRPAKR